MWFWFPRMAIVYVGGGREKWCLLAPLFLQETLLDPCLSGPRSEITVPPVCPWRFSDCWFHARSAQLLDVLSL